MKILVVDNDAIACEYLVQTLKELGAEADWVDNGEDAVKRIAAAGRAGAGFDMVLLDWRMPGMDGLQTTREIRKGADKNIPILIASAYDWGDIEEEAVEAGVNGFLQKPLFKSNLCRGIQNHIYERRPHQKKEKLRSLEGLRFLLVEDNLLNCEIAEELLAAMEAEVETAHDGEEGVELFGKSQEGYYNMILMDIQMPRMNGYAAAHAIRALPRKDSAGIPIIALTADAFSEDVEAAKRAGMNSHLAKPFDMASLNREIGKFL